MPDVQPPDGKPARGSSDLLAIGFGTTVAMWAVGYVGNMPLTDVPPVIFVSLLLACVVAGGWIVGRKTARGVGGGIGVGLIVALLNLLILGSFLSTPNTGQVVPHVGLWVPGFFLICVALCDDRGRNWDSVFSPARNGRRLGCRVCLGRLRGYAAFDLDRRPGHRFCAGMAVKGWPDTFGYNMFFYPFSKMTGGVFYEHAHRLMGSLVGLTTFTLAVVLTLRRRSIAVLVLIWIVGLGVAAQGIMGGLRVTENNVNLAVLHGFFAHVVLAGMVTVAVLLSRGRNSRMARLIANGSTASFPRCWCRACCCKRCSGALVRQKNVCLQEHIVVATFVIIFAIVVGARLWGLYPHIRVFARGGAALIAVVVVQMLLGGISLAVRTPPAVESPSAEQLRSSDAMQPAPARADHDPAPDECRGSAGPGHVPGDLVLAAARQLAAKQQRGRNRRRLRLLDLRVANLHCLLQALQRVLIFGRELLPDVATIARVHDRLHDLAVVQRLRVVDLVAAGHASGVEVAPAVGVLLHVFHDVLLHHAGVVDVVEHLDPRRADAMHKGHAPLRRVGHVVLVIVRVEELQANSDLLLFRVGGQLLQAGDGVGQALLVAHEVALGVVPIAGKADYVGVAGVGGEVDPLLDLGAARLVVLDVVEADGILWLWTIAQISPCFFSVGHASGGLSSIDFSPSLRRRRRTGRGSSSRAHVGVVATEASGVFDMAF